LSKQASTNRAPSAEPNHQATSCANIPNHWHGAPLITATQIPTTPSTPTCQPYQSASKALNKAVALPLVGQAVTRQVPLDNNNIGILCSAWWNGRLPRRCLVQARRIRGPPTVAGSPFSAGGVAFPGSRPRGGVASHLASCSAGAAEAQELLKSAHCLLIDSAAFTPKLLHHGGRFGAPITLRFLESWISF
jgi:hypothetical protein